MNFAKPLITAALAAASFAAQAGGGVDRYPFTVDTHSTTSRAAVQAERAATQAQDSHVAGDASTPFVVVAGGRSRAEVKAELAAAQRLGLLSRGEGDALVASPAQQAQIDRAGRTAAMAAVRSGGAG